MPELPEVETTCRGIAPYSEQKIIQDVIIRDHRLRWPVDAELPKILRLQTIVKISRRAKYLVLDFDHGSLLVHLGMSGSFRVLKKGKITEPEKHDHIDVVLETGDILRYNDPRRFGSFIWTQAPVGEHALISHLGPEPLSDEFTADYLFTKSRKKTVPAKSWIMDSKVVVGVGNIYANESLFNARIHPLKKAGKLTRKDCERWVLEIKEILSYAIQRGGTTLRDFVGGDGKPGYFAQELAVYGHGGEPCKSCGKPLSERRIAQRATVYCTRCQK